VTNAASEPLLDTTTVESSLTCPMCGKECKSKSGLTRHQKVHSSTTTSTSIVEVSESAHFVCDLCGKICRNRSGLTRHKQKCVLQLQSS
jgi:predicted RNA-binding Zn-ribbon protein involved in translation (DUF1610 family)